MRVPFKNRSQGSQALTPLFPERAPSTLAQASVSSAAGLSLSACLSASFLIAVTTHASLLGDPLVTFLLTLLDSIPGLFALLVAGVCSYRVIRSRMFADLDSRIVMAIAAIPMGAAFSVLYLKWLLPELSIGIF